MELDDFPDGTDVLRRTTELLANDYGFDMTWVAEPADGGAVVRHLFGNRTESFRGTLLRNGRGLGGAAHASGRVRWVEDYFHSPEITHDYDRSVAVEQIARAVAAPIVAGNVVYGVLIGGHRTAGVVGTRSLEIVESAAQRCAEACYYADRVRTSMRATVFEYKRRTALAMHEAVEATMTSIDARLHGNGRLSSNDESVRSRIRAIERQADDAAASWMHSVSERGAGAWQTPAADARKKLPTGEALAKRQYEVLCRVGRGETNVEIARAMHLSANTVKSYLQNVMAKLGARNRVEAVVYAKALGLL